MVRSNTEVFMFVLHNFSCRIICAKGKYPRVGFFLKIHIFNQQQRSFYKLQTNNASLRGQTSGVFAQLKLH